MSDLNPTPAHDAATPTLDDDPQYVDEYVEIVDDRRRVVVLGVVLLLLVLSIAVLGWFLWGSLNPPGAPRGEITEGMTWVRSIYGWGDTAEQRLRRPISVAVAPDGTYWTVSSQRTIVGFDQNGVLSGQVTLPNGEGPGEIRSIEDIDFDDEGNLYVVDYGNAKVLKVLPNGTVDGEIFVTFPQRIALRGDQIALGSVRGMALFGREQGDLITQWGGRGTEVDRFDSVRGVEFGEDGTIFTSDSLNRRIKAYTPEGRLVWSFPDTQTVELARKLDELTTEDRGRISDQIPFELPQGLTVDAAGRILVTDAFKSRLSALDPRNGEVQATYGRDGALDGEFSYVSDIAYDTQRDQFVIADAGNDRLQVVRITGSGGTPVALVRRLASGPVWVCCIPPLVLLVLIALAVSRSRRRRREQAASRFEPDAPGAADAP